MHDSTNGLACQGRDDLLQLAKKRRSNDVIKPWMRKHLSDAAFAWIDLADTAIQSQSGDYQTYTTFRDKFTQNHDRLVGGAYNREAALYNETFDEPLVQALQPISFTEPLVTFREQEAWS